jgi:hypothetical protein
MARNEFELHVTISKVVCKATRYNKFLTAQSGKPEV